MGTRVRRGAEKGEDGDLSKEEQKEALEQLRAQYEKYELNEYSAEIWKKTSFFTNGNHVDLFLDLNQHLEDMDIHASVSDSVFKVKFDATPSQAQKVFKFYAEKINALPADIQTAAQKAILEKPETKAILEGKTKLRQLASSSFSESGTSKRQRTTKSPRRLRKTTNPKSPAVSTSPTETKPQRN